MFKRRIGDCEHCKASYGFCVCGWRGSPEFPGGTRPRAATTAAREPSRLERKIAMDSAADRLRARRKRRLGME